MDHPSPHMVSLLEAVAEHGGCTIEVLYCDRSAPGRSWGAPVGNVPHEFVGGFAGPMGLQFNPGVLRAMNRLQIDIWVINTIYSSPTTLMAAWWLHFSQKPWVYMNEPVRPRTGIQAFLKRFPLRFVLDRACGIITTGQAAVDRYRRCMPKDMPFESVPYFIDTSDFLNLPVPDAPSKDRDFQFVTVSRLIEGKGLDCLLHACKKLPDAGWHLTLIGEGPLRSRLERKAKEYGLLDRVRIVGPVPYSRRVSAFAEQHVFIFPSLWDGWGMVVPEALASGLPVVSTDQVTSAHEFITNGRYGFTIPAGDPDALADKMRWFMQNRSFYSGMSREARESTRHYRPELGAETLVGFLQRLRNKSAQQQDLVTPGPKREEISWNYLTTSRNSFVRAKLRLRSAAKKAVIRSRVFACRPQKAKGHSIIGYHLVLKEDRQNFEDQLKFYRDHFRISSLRDLLQAAARNDSGDFRLAITFDDGFALLMQDCLDVLEKYGIKVAFYIPTAFIGAPSRDRSTATFSTRSFYYRYPLEPMKPDDLKKLSALGHEVGCHGLYHLNIHSMMPETVSRNLSISRSMISEWTGLEPNGYAYPYGRTSNVQGNPAEWLQEAGFTYALTLSRGTVDSSTDMFALPRHHAEGNWSIPELQYFLLS
jgi:glycosyltransferase involved in cell wall biosynthesis/peptidoglycan/xylan/chitin deacetylase (PgdA/CDA1 family)